MVKLAIVGSRNFNDYKKLEKEVDGIRSDVDVTLIVSGGCKGADSLAEKYAISNNIPISIHKPDWDMYGKAAGPIRNKLIIDEADIVLAFPQKGVIHSGTRNSISLANKAHKKVIITEI